MNASRNESVFSKTTQNFSLPSILPKKKVSLKVIEFQNKKISKGLNINSDMPFLEDEVVFRRQK